MHEDLLKKLYNACDPMRPATLDYYTDCIDGRGDSALTRDVLAKLKLAGEEKYLCYLFSGHIGCGKSSELQHLRNTLLNAEGLERRYFPVLLDVSEYLDDYDVAPIDILLAIVTELASSLRTQLNIDLKDNYFEKRLQEVKDYFLSDAEINEGVVPLLGAKIKIQRLKRAPEARKKVREALFPHMSTMVEEINTVFDEARVALKKYQPPAGEKRFDDLLLILDSLERIQRIDGMEEGLPSQRELFLERYFLLTGMAAHVIYTVPLRLIRSKFGPQLISRYGQLFVLPMVKVFLRGTCERYERGWHCIDALLKKRIGAEHSLAEVFTEEARVFLIHNSGGHIRNLMTFIQNACSNTDGLPIPLSAVHKAIGQTVRTYSTGIEEAHWAKLVALERSLDQQIPGGDDDYLAMLENMSILEYINGGSEDPFDSYEPWYAVNPIVRELRKFKEVNAKWVKPAE